MNIVTAADSGFAHCLIELAKNVRKHYGKPIIVYDLGLTEENRKQLDAVIIPFEVDDQVDYKGKAYLSDDGNESTRATHKPFCVQHYFENYNEPMILVDADCMFNEKVELEGFDVGVTRRMKRKPGRVHYNGAIFSGVIMFNTPSSELLERWAQECRKENTTDQKAISDVLGETIDWNSTEDLQEWNGLKIKLLDTKLYNDFHLTKKGKIIHFATSKHKEGIYEHLIEGYNQGKDIRKIFRLLKRGKKSHVDTAIDFVKKLFGK